MSAAVPERFMNGPSGPYEHSFTINAIRGVLLDTIGLVTGGGGHVSYWWTHSTGHERTKHGRHRVMRRSVQHERGALRRPARDGS